MSVYPILENANFVSSDQISRYLNIVFAGIEWNSENYLSIRGIGEKGTPQEGVFREETFIQPHLENAVSRILTIATTYAQNHVATFVIPCTLKKSRGTSANVDQFTNVLADLDSGDTDAALRYLNENLGAPSLIVKSGGTTDTGHEKRHVYYSLTEPCSDISKIVRLRDYLAKKAGGDIQFGLGVQSNPYGRAHQPIRIAGTCHSKGGDAAMCSIESVTEFRYPLEVVGRQIESMAAASWIPNLQSGMDGLFSQYSGRQISDSLTQPVTEGGTDVTRWGEFSKVCGHYVHLVRRGQMTVQEAEDATLGWVATTMVPPWPDQRSLQEFRAICNRDQITNGAFPKKEEPIIPTGAGIAVWSAHRWVTEPAPKHEFLVDKLLIMGEPHLFVSEGGAGKTHLMLDLAMKIACYGDGDDYQWCGQKIQSTGTVVLLLCEDSKTETHIRLSEMNRNGMISRAGDKLIVIPLTSAGGAFPLVEREKSTGGAISSRKWNEMMYCLSQIKDLKLVVMDTLNSVSHGDENSAMAIAEMMRQAHRICGELGAAIIFNHHVRKIDPNMAIRNLKDLGNAIRGSSAIPSYFRICMGIFHCSDFDRRMRAMNLKPEKEQLWRFGIAKANIKSVMKGERTLLRNRITGLLEDCTQFDRFNMVNHAEREAWLILAIKLAAINRHPYMTGKTGKNSLYSRRAELPPILKKVGATEFSVIVEDGLQEDKLAVCAVKGSKSKGYLDIADGPIATDVTGMELDSGAYTHLPDWNQYEFVRGSGMVVHRKDIHHPFDRMQPMADTIPEVGMLPASLI